VTTPTTKHATTGCACATCEHERTRKARADASLARALRTIADRQAGRKRWRGAGAALTWYSRTRAAWASPKALTVRDEGTGAPSLGAESPARRLFAAVAGAIAEAERDDRERNAAKAAPLPEWIAEHYGAGRALMWMAEASSRWTEREMQDRMRRMCRVVRDHLRRGGWLEDENDDEDTTA
jgi:hypothetical protein